MEERDITFKVGTKVKLRDYLKTGLYYGGQKFEEFCKQDFGKVLTITKVTPCNGYISTTKYEFEETPLEYTAEMLEPIKEKTMKYKVGDKVRIKKDLEANKWYGIEIVVNGMLKCAGRSATITKVVECDEGIKYSIDISGWWNWTEEMFEPIADNGFKIGDKVVIRDDLIPGKKYEEWDYSPEDGMGGWEFAATMAKYMGKVATITGYVADDPNYCRLDIDKGTYSWIVNALLPYTPGSDYDLDKTVITNKQQTKQNYENRLQEKGPVIAGRERQSGCAVRYPGEQIRVGISNLGYRKVTYKR